MRKGPTAKTQQSAWRRMWKQNHYAAKGLSFHDFVALAKQDCAYCGSPPTAHNPNGNIYNPSWHNNCTYEWWLANWIRANGIDKIIPTTDYSDLSNLCPCCSTCNWLKGTMGRDAFLAHIEKIHRHQAS